MSSYSDYVRDNYDSDSDTEDYCDWLDKVESIVEDKTGFSLRELPDQQYRLFFEDGYSPEISAESFIDDWRINGDIPK